MQLGLTDEAIEARRLGIGGSDAGKIVRGEWFELWQLKLDLRKDRKIMSDWQAAWRYCTETLQMDWYEHTHPGEFAVDRGLVVVSQEYPFMRCTLDARLSPSGVPINAKHVSKWTKEAREWAIDHYTPQAVHEAICCNADYALLSLLHGEKEPEIIRIDRDPVFDRRLIRMEREFWSYVERKEPPPDAPPEKVPMLATDMKKLREIVLRPGEGLPRGENWLPEMISEISVFAGTKPAADLHAITRDRIKAIVPEDVGGIQYGLFSFKRDRRGVTLSLAKSESDDENP